MRDLEKHNGDGEKYPPMVVFKDDLGVYRDHDGNVVNEFSETAIVLRECLRKYI
jgi:hypothetical protein